MVHNLNDREPWRRQGEEYLRKVGSKLPVFYPPFAAARATREVEGYEQDAGPVVA